MSSHRLSTSFHGGRSVREGHYHDNKRRERRFLIILVGGTRLLNVIWCQDEKSMPVVVICPRCELCSAAE